MGQEVKQTISFSGVEIGLVVGNSFLTFLIPKILPLFDSLCGIQSLNGTINEILERDSLLNISNSYE